MVVLWRDYSILASGPFAPMTRPIHVCLGDVIAGDEPAEGWHTQMLDYINQNLHWLYDTNERVFITPDRSKKIPVCWLCTLKEDIYWIFLPQKICEVALTLGY